MNLNPEQEKAANHKDGPCLVTACPGSGKTRTIVERTARLINSGISPSSILSISFTNKAAGELKDRVEKRIGDAANQVFISTFHRLASSILRYHGHHIGYTRNMTILDDDGQVDLMSQVARQLGFELSKPQILQILWQTNDSRENIENDDQIFKRFKDIDENYYGIAVEYIRRLHASNSIDFSGLLSETVRLLSNHKVVLDAAQSKWKYFQVDEVQDTNYAQFKIIELLSSHTKNVFVVGDLDQTIYSWRGARADNLRDFAKLYSGTVVISLGKNYRSTPQIVAVADKLIRHNQDRIAAPFTTDNPDGPPVACKAYLNDAEEAESIALAIRDGVSRGDFKYQDIAVFYRTNNMSRAIEMAMINHGIPHTLIGGFSFFDRKEVKDCISMLKFLINPLDGVSFHRICNKPRRSIGDVTIGKLELFAKEHHCTIMEAVQKMDVGSENVQKGLKEIIDAFSFNWAEKTIAECLTFMVEKLRYKDFIAEDPETALERQQNIDELIRDAAKFGNENVNSISSYLEQIALLSSYDKSADGNSVSLMTLHASKGLEFPVVYMLGVEDKIIPHSKAINDRADGLEEERRLCYVGMTRAQQKLNVSYCVRRQDNIYAKAGKVQYKQSRPSQFLIESGLIKK